MRDYDSLIHIKIFIFNTRVEIHDYILTTPVYIDHELASEVVLICQQFYCHLTQYLETLDKWTQDEIEENYFLLKNLKEGAQLDNREGLLFLYEFQVFQNAYCITKEMMKRFFSSSSANKLPKLKQIFTDFEKTIHKIYEPLKNKGSYTLQNKNFKLTKYQFIADFYSSCQALYDERVFRRLPVEARGISQNFDYNNLIVIIDSFIGQLIDYMFLFKRNTISLKIKVLISNVNYPLMLAAKMYDELILQKEYFSEFDSTTLKNILNRGICSRQIGKDFASLRSEFCLKLISFTRVARHIFYAAEKMIFSAETCLNFPVNHSLARQKLLSIFDYYLNALKPHIQIIKIINKGDFLDFPHPLKYLPLSSNGIDIERKMIKHKISPNIMDIYQHGTSENSPVALPPCSEKRLIPIPKPFRQRNRNVVSWSMLTQRILEKQRLLFNIASQRHGRIFNKFEAVLNDCNIIIICRNPKKSNYIQFVGAYLKQYNQQEIVILSDESLPSGSKEEIIYLNDAIQKYYKNHRNYPNINFTDDSIEVFNILSQSSNSTLDIISLNEDAFLMLDFIWQCCAEYAKNARLSYELTKEYQKIARKYFLKIVDKLMTQMEYDNCPSYFLDIWKKIDRLNYDLLTSVVNSKDLPNFQLIDKNIIHEVLSSVSKNREYLEKIDDEENKRLYREIVEAHQNKPKAKIIVIVDAKHVLDFKGKEPGIFSVLDHFFEESNIKIGAIGFDFDIKSENIYEANESIQLSLVSDEKWGLCSQNHMLNFSSDFT